MLKRTLKGLTAFILIAFIAIPAYAQNTTTITDLEGRQVEVPTNAQRVLLGFYFEDFLAIVGPDAYSRVTAISRAAWHDWRNLQWQSYTKVLPVIDKLTDVGEVDAGTFSLETAIASKPDVAIIAQWQFSALGDAVDKMTNAGIPVVVVDYNAQTVEKHVASTMLIGTIMGTQARAKKLADEYAAAVADVQTRVKNATQEPKRVYVELGNKGPDEYGNTYGNHMWGQMVTTAGGKNIALGQVGKWAPINPEFVLASDPEVILIAGSSWVNRDKAVLMGPTVEAAITRERLSAYKKRPGWENLSAVKNNEIHGLYHGGARTLYDYAMLQYMAKVMYPEAFADVDPQATLKRFFDTYLPIEANGAYMVDLK